MKVLLTGGSGFIGSHVLALLQREDVDVVTLGRSKISPSFRHIECDLLAEDDLYTLLLKEKATHLVHLAWETEHGKYWTSPINLQWVKATLDLVEAFCSSGGHYVIMAGTCAEYDWNYGYCVEADTPLNPLTLYGTAKDATRRLVAAICKEHNVPFGWGRLFLPFGRGEAQSRLIPSLIQVFQGKRRVFPINLTVYRDFLHASDVATGFFQLLTSNADGSYNISSGMPVRLNEVVNMLADILVADPGPILAQSIDRLNEPELLIGNNEKLNRLGWNPALSMWSGLEHTLNERWRNVSTTE